MAGRPAETNGTTPRMFNEFRAGTGLLVPRGGGRREGGGGGREKQGRAAKEQRACALSCVRAACSAARVLRGATRA